MNSLLLRQEINEMYDQNIKVEFQIQELHKSIDGIQKQLEKCAVQEKDNLEKIEKSRGELEQEFNRLEKKVEFFVNQVTDIVKLESGNNQKACYEIHNQLTELIKKERSLFENKICDTNNRISELNNKMINMDNKVEELKSKVLETRDLLGNGITVVQSDTDRNFENMAAVLNSRFDQMELYNKKRKWHGRVKFIIEVLILLFIILEIGGLGM